MVNDKSIERKAFYPFQDFAALVDVNLLVDFSKSNDRIEQFLKSFVVVFI